MILSNGNKKLPTSTSIFNLPAVKTCPGSTPECRKWCYARKAERIYPQVLPFREKNFKLSLTDVFVTQVKAELSRKKKVDTVRIHESGDFYNQAYFNKWVEIAEGNPNMTFYAYTKNMLLDFSKRPKNFILLLSDDNKEFKSKWHLYNGVATVSKEHVESKKGWTVCPGSCKTCNVCYTKPSATKKIIFNVH